jgi:hypothetical protein
MSDTVETVPALWVGYPGEGPDRSTLVPGETVREIPREEAETSGYWQLVDPDKPFAGYDDTPAEKIIDRLARATADVASAVLAYESAHKQRKTVLDAAQARVDELEQSEENA